MTTVYTVRHAQSAGNLKKIFQGRLDIGLSEMGMEQLEPLSKRFEHVAVSAVYSSPLKRARQTAEAICHVCHAPLIIDQRLIEIDGALSRENGMKNLLSCSRKDIRLGYTMPGHLKPQMGNPCGKSMIGCVRRSVRL